MNAAINAAMMAAFIMGSNVDCLHGWEARLGRLVMGRGGAQIAVISAMMTLAGLQEELEAELKISSS